MGLSPSKKRCARCSRLLPKTRFEEHTYYRDGLYRDCLDCRSLTRKLADHTEKFGKDVELKRRFSEAIRKRRNAGQ